jgi:hypothetical protein
MMMAKYLFATVQTATYTNVLALRWLDMSLNLVIASVPVAMVLIS